MGIQPISGRDAAFTVRPSGFGMTRTSEIRKILIIILVLNRILAAG